MPATGMFVARQGDIMAQRLSRQFDRKVRLGGAALLLLATLLIVFVAVPQSGGAAVAVGPDLGLFCVVLVAVCAASTGAAALFVGAALFEPVSAPPARRSTGNDAPRSEG